MLTDELVGHFAGPLSIVIGTRDADLRPCFLRAFGIEGNVGSSTVALHVPERTAGPTLENLEANGRIAVQMASWADFSAYQLKGHVTAIEAAGPDADAVMDANTERVVQVLGQVISEAFSDGWARFVSRPALTIAFRLEEAFLQTPGPNAGTRVV